MPRETSYFDELARLWAMERGADRARLAELRQGLTLGELEARGLVLLDVVAADSNVGLGGRALVTLEREDGRGLTARWSAGDLVEVRPRRAESPPAPATVSRASRRNLELAFERSPPPFVFEGRLRVDCVANEATYDRARDALGLFKGHEKGAERRRRDVLLGQRPPTYDRPPAYEPGRPLNDEQKAAVDLALGAQDFFLVHGPPGTGKSTVLAEIAVQSVARGERLLCTAASNAAVDHLLELCLERGLRAVRVGHPARVSPALQGHTLDLLVEDHPDRKLARELFDEGFELLGYARKQRAQGRSRQRFANARASSSEAYKLFDEARVLERKAVRSILDGAQVVCATCSMLTANLLGPESFDLALLDEATQATEPVSLMAFLKAPRVVLAGDHKQLPPTVLSMEASRAGLSRSLFERLLDEHGDATRRMLRVQYRMHADIMAFPSQEMYGGALEAFPAVAARTLAEVLSPGAEVDAPPVLFLDTAGKGFDDSSAAAVGAGTAGSESQSNEGEAGLVVARVRELLAAGLAPRELAVIAPYRAQAELLRETLSRPEELEVEVDTIDAFQGREKDAILVSLTRSNPSGEIGFLADLRRMNVAMTRARRHLFVVGDSATLSQTPFYARFIEAVQARGGYRSAWEWPGEATSA